MKSHTLKKKESGETNDSVLDDLNESQKLENLNETLKRNQSVNRSIRGNRKDIWRISFSLFDSYRFEIQTNSVFSKVLHRKFKKEEKRG